MARPLLVLVAVLTLAGCVTVGTVTPLHEAVRDGRMSAAETEVARGADIDAVDEEGRTPLHYACANGDDRAVEWLLALGAQTDRQDVNGETPLHYASVNCYAESAKRLVAAGADPGLANGDGMRPLDLARESGCREVVALLETLTAEAGPTE